MTARTWLGRVAASLVLVLGALVFTSALETGSVLLFALAGDGILGALLLIFGIERPAYPLSRFARLIGWAMMFAFTLVPTSLLFIPTLIVLFAIPTVRSYPVSPLPETGSSASHVPGPS
jgi:hypothetical protein